MSSTWMTESEICASFRQAKDQKKQIGILADLNACTGKKIKEILYKNGLFPLQREKAAIEPEKKGNKTMRRPWTLDEVEFMLAKAKAGVPYKEIAADLGRRPEVISAKMRKLREEGMKIAEELAAEEAKAAKEQGAIKQKEPSKAMDKEKNISIAEMLLAGYKSLSALSGLEDEIVIEIKKGQVQMHAACDGCVVTITFEGEKA